VASVLLGVSVGGMGSAAWKAVVAGLLLHDVLVPPPP
jgi:hypothetical protein